MPNFIRAPADTQECPRHRCVHPWNVIDLASSFVDTAGEDTDIDEKKFRTIRTLQWDHYTSEYFFHGDRDYY